MRGVYYRTEKDGTPLATPELRISATNNRTVYYDNQTAKEAALQNDEIKEGSIVLTGYADGESEVLMKQQPDWENAVSLTVAQLQSGYVVPSDGLIVGWTSQPNKTTAEATVNGVVVAIGEIVVGGYVCYTNVQCMVNKGDIFKIKYVDTSYISFVPFKTVAEPLTLPVNVMNNPSLPDYSRAIGVTTSQLSTGYTAPANGIFCLSGTSPDNSARGYVTINGTIVASSIAGANVGYRECQVQIPVSKNDVIRTVDGNNNGQVWLLHITSQFIPFKN